MRTREETTQQYELSRRMRGQLARACREAKDDGEIVFCSMPDHLLDHDNCYIAMREAGGFTAWTATRVYFPLKYDGDIWIGSAPRNPCEELVKPPGWRMNLTDNPRGWVCSDCGKVFLFWPQIHYRFTRAGSRLICQGVRR